MENPQKNLQIFIFLFLSTSVIAVTLSGLFPSFGVYYFHHITPDILKGANLTSAYLHIEHLEKLRSGLITTIPQDMKGIITFPSFHASLAVIFIIVSRNMKYLKWVFLVLNSVMILATPLHGSHYLVDVIAGIVIVFMMFAITKLPVFQIKQPDNEAAE